jgi:arsenate reductase (thioredoxin)
VALFFAIRFSILRLDFALKSDRQIGQRLEPDEIDTRFPPHRKDRRAQARHVDADVGAVTQHHIEEMVDTLVAEFGDRFERAQIEELMADSARQLAGGANVEDFVPVLAYRFARERLTSLSRSSGTGADIVFVSLSGGGRGQIAAALTSFLSDGTVTAHAAGTSQHGVLDPTVEEAIRELGVDMSDAYVRPVSRDILTGADVVVTLGQSVGQVAFPDGIRHEDWRVGDPIGASFEEVRRVRDDIERRVRALLSELGVDAADDSKASEWSSDS